jgi:DNA ligase (NAD+)
MYPKEEQQHLQQLSQQLIKGESDSSIEEKAAMLRQVINYHDWRYYVLSEPIITDFDYDSLFKQLKELEAQHPALITPDSPSQRVARGLTDEFQSVAHLASMLSLENSYNLGDIEEFHRRVTDLVKSSDIEYCVEPKFDGASIALVYESDLLIRAATRGDGTVGEDITNNAKAIPSIPLSAAFSKFGIHKIEIRGEVIITKEIFEKKNAERVAKGEKPFQNSRNTASGSLRMKDPNEVAQRGLEAVLYHVSFAEDANGKNLIGEKLLSHYSIIEMLYNCGFKTPLKELKVCHSAVEVDDFINTWDIKRHTFGIETDGMVVKVNSLKMQQQCGSTSHHPRWAIAYKFAAKQAQSKLLKVEFQVGRTGAVTPVAKIEPVPLAGVTISSISLHNEEFISEKDLLLGDTVIVERAGEVIPYIVGSIPDLRTGNEIKIEFPRHCPSCNSPLVKPEEDAIWRCDNADCPAQTEERAIHFVSKDAMDIDGCGRETVIEFIQRGFIKTIEDLYRLPYENILGLEGWKEKSVNNLKTGIEESKNRPLWRLLNALGIRHVGVTTSKDLAKHIQSVFDLAKMRVEDLTNIEGIGPKVAQSIFDFFQNQSNIHLLHELKNFGVNTENRPEDALAKNNKLEGKTFLFTGSLQKFTRDRAKQLVEENGGKLLSSVSANLNYLVVGEDAGSKLTKAQKIPSIVVLTEDEFLNVLNPPKKFTVDSILQIAKGFSKKTRAERSYADREIQRIASELTSAEILILTNSQDEDTKVAVANAIQPHITKSNEDLKWAAFLGNAVLEGDSFLRYRALVAISKSDHLIENLRNVLYDKVLSEPNSRVKAKLNELFS